MNTRWLLSLFLVFTLLQSHSVAQTPLLQDGFSRNGSLAGSSPDVGSTWNTISGTATLLQITSGRLIVPPSGEQSVQSTFAAQSNTTVYAGFTLNFSTLPSAGTLAISFRGAEGYIGRIFLVRNAAGSTFRVGIDNNLDNPVYWPIPLDLSKDFRIVLGFTENGSVDQTRLWVNPASIDDRADASKF